MFVAQEAGVLFVPCLGALGAWKTCNLARYGFASEEMLEIVRRYALPQGGGRYRVQRSGTKRYPTPNATGGEHEAEGMQKAAGNAQTI